MRARPPRRSPLAALEERPAEGALLLARPLATPGGVRPHAHCQPTHCMQDPPPVPSRRADWRAGGAGGAQNRPHASRAGRGRKKKKGGGRESGRPLPRPCSLARLLVGQDRRALDVQDGRSPPTQPVARLGRQRRGGRGGDGAPSCGRYLPPRERGRERAHSPHVSPSLRLSLTLPPQTANHAPSHGTGRGRPRWRPRRWRTGRLWSTAEPGGGRRKKRQRCY